MQFHVHSIESPILDSRCLQQNEVLLQEVKRENTDKPQIHSDLVFEFAGF